MPIVYHKSAAVREAVDKLYADLTAAGLEVLLDDRDERPGVMFADMDLVGLPHRVVLGDKGLAKGVIEYKGRRDKAPRDIPLDEAVAQLPRMVNSCRASPCPRHSSCQSRPDSD